ncbi:unnamed protein product, partial [Closterium sp. NIES-65]
AGHELPGMICQASCHVASSPMAALRALHVDSLRASTGAATPPPHEWALRLAASHASSARAAEGGRSHLPSHGSPFLRAACSDLLALLLDGE